MASKNIKSILIGLFITATLSVYAGAAPSEAFTLNTHAFHNTGTLPTRYTCDGEDVSPKLEWANVPINTQSLAIIISDPDAPSGTFYHWIVYNISPHIKTIGETTNQLPPGAIVGKNDFGKLQYNGPCPPKGQSHTYIITLYALDAMLNLPAGADAKIVLSDMQNHIIGKAELTATYSR